MCHRVGSGSDSVVEWAVGSRQLTVSFSTGLLSAGGPPSTAPPLPLAIVSKPTATASVAESIDGPATSASLAEAMRRRTARPRRSSVLFSSERSEGGAAH